MSTEKKQSRDDNSQNVSGKKGTVRKSPAGKGHLFKRWKDPSENRMGNDISSEIKIANSKGEREGGSDKRWHMNEGE